LDSVETHLPPLPDSSAVARAFVRHALQTWDVDVSGDVSDLLVTEVVSNVVRHVGQAMTLRITRSVERGSVRVEVEDPSDTPPVRRDPGSRAERGRGLLLVDALASRWGVDHHAAGGKCVWFEMEPIGASEHIRED
jgi:anti-sigma regulatory factor (Ser/Thr protein kinase)